MTMVKEDRNYGIDLLRIVSMFMVVVLHILGAGGIIKSSDAVMVIHNRAAWLLEVFCYCAVNCYAIISGYVGVNGKIKFTNIIMLWLQVMFYNVLITVIFWIIGIETINIISIKNMLLPILTGRYWYFTAYFLMFMFIPILNLALNKLSKKEMGIILGVGFVLLSICPTILESDVFHLMKGYSAFWLMFLYLIGGYIKKYNLFSKIKSWEWLIYYICFSLFTFLSKIGFEFITIRMFGYIKFNKMFIEYTSPTILLMGICLFMFFSKLKLFKISKIISFFSSLSFSVYLIHNHPLIVNEFWNNKFLFLLEFNPFIMIIFVLIIALGVYLVCSLLDVLRLFIFDKTNIKKKIYKLESKYLNDVFK